MLAKTVQVPFIPVSHFKRNILTSFLFHILKGFDEFKRHVNNKNYDAANNSLNVLKV
jgi:hypothetical protein